MIGQTSWICSVVNLEGEALDLRWGSAICKNKHLSRSIPANRWAQRRKRLSGISGPIALFGRNRGSASNRLAWFTEKIIFTEWKVRHRQKCWKVGEVLQGPGWLLWGWEACLWCGSGQTESGWSGWCERLSIKRDATRDASRLQGVSLRVTTKPSVWLGQRTSEFPCCCLFGGVAFEVKNEIADTFVKRNHNLNFRVKLKQTLTLWNRLN